MFQRGLISYLFPKRGSKLGPVVFGATVQTAPKMQRGELNLPFAEPLNCAVLRCALRKMVASNEAGVSSSGTRCLTRLLVALCTF